MQIATEHASVAVSIASIPLIVSPEYRFKCGASPIALRGLRRIVPAGAKIILQAVKGKNYLCLETYQGIAKAA